MARDILKEYGIGHFQSASGSLPTHKMCNWKMIGNNFEHFQYFKNCNDMKKFLKKQSDAIQDSPPEIIVHDQRNSWHDHTTWVDTYTKKSPWEMDELDYYYGSEYRATTNSFPTPKEFYSNEMTKFVNWFHPDPKKFFVSGSDKNAQKLRLFNAFMATRKRFENFLKVAPPDPSNTFVRHLVEMNVNDADDRDKVEDILLHFHHLGLHLPGFWTLYKTPSGKVVVYNPRLDHYMGYIKGHMFPKLCLYDKAQFDYVNCATYHILWKMERQPQSAKPQIRPGPQSKAQMPSFTEHSSHHVGQSRAEKEMLTRGAMVVGRMKHFAILPFTIEFGQPTTPFMETNVRFDDIGNFRVERYPVSIDMDAIELIPQKSTTPSLASSRNPRPKNSYRSNVVFETVDKKLIAAYTQAGITFQMGCVHRLEVLPRDAPVDIRSATQERHTTFLTTDGYFLKYPSSVAVNNASAQIEPDLWYCDIPNMIASEPPADASLVREFRRTSMNPSAQRSQPEFSDGNFGNDKPGNYEQTRPDKADAPVRARVYRVVNSGPAGTRQMKNMVYAGGQRLVPAKAVNGNGTYRTIVRNYVPVQRVVQPTQRAPPVEYNTMMLSTNGSGQPKRQYIASRQGSQQAGPSRQAHAAVIAAQQRVIPLPSNGRNHPQGRLPSPPQVPQEKPVPKVGNECALMADLFYQQVAKEVVINEDGVQIEEHDMPLLDLEQSIDALDNSFDQQEPTTSQCFTEEHSYCKPVKARSQTSQTVPASLHRQKQQSDVREIGISGLGNDMGANTNQLNVVGPSKIEHNKRIKKKEAPVIENRPHLNKPTRTRYNGVAASMKELPPLTKPRHPDGPKPVNVSTTTLAAHIPEAKEMIAAQTKRRPGRPKLTTTSRGVEGKKNKEVIIAVLQTHQPEVVPPNLKLPEDRLGDLVQKQKETLDKIFRSSETKPAKRRKAKSRLTTAPRKSKGRRRQYVKQDVKMQKEMDLAVVGCVLDLLNHFGDIPDPEFDPRAIPLSRKSINIKKGMRPYMERRRLLWRLRCDGPVDSLTAPKTKAAKSSTRESSVYTAPGFLESLLNLTERQMTKKGYDRTIVECLDELVNQLDVVTEDLQQEKREIDVITLEDQVPLSATLHEDQMEIEEPATENVVTEMEEDADIGPYEPHDHFDDVNLYIPAPEVSSTDKDDQDALAEIIHEVKTVVEDVIDKVTIAAELAVIPAPVDLAPKCPVEVKTAAMKDVIQWEVPEAVHFEEFVAVDNYEIDRIFTQDITAEPSIEPVPLVAKEIFEVLPEAVAVIDFLCSKLHEQEASDEPVFEKIKEEAIITEEEPTTKLAGLGWVQKSTDQQAVASELCQEEDDEPEITILEVRGQESSTALPTKEPIIVDPEIASLLEEMLTDVMFFHDLHLVVDYLVNRVEMEHEQEEEGFVSLSSQNAGNVTVSTKVPAGSCRAEESRNDMTLIAGMLHRLAGDVAEQIAKEDEEEELTMKALDFSWLEKEALDTFADEIAENAIMYAAEDVSQKRMEEISDFQGTTEEQSDQPTAAVASSAAELPMPPITEEPQMPPSTSHFYDDIENDMGDLSVPLFSAPTANVSSIIESTKSLHREADSERPLGIPFEEEDDFFNFKEPENLVEVQSSAVVLEENNDETKSFVGTHFLEADVEDQAIRNRTFSEVSSISEEAASRRNHPALRSETPEAILTSREPSPAVEETFAKTIPPVAESTVDESLSFEELTVSQPDCQDEDIQRLLNGDGPGAPPPSQALNTIDSFMNDDESATVPVPAVQLPAVRNTYDKQETMLHGQLPRYHEQNNIGMGPYQLQNNITRVHHNYSQPISTGWSTTPFASAQQPPIQQGYPQQMQNTYYHPPQYPHMNTPWGMNALGTNSFMVRSHHPNLTTQHAWSDYQQPGQAFPPINAVYPNPVQPQQMMNHNMPGVQSFNGGYFRGPLQQQISYNYTQPQHQQQPMPPMAYHQGQGPYPVHQNQMANQEIRRQLEQRQMRTQRPVPQHLRHEPREVVVNIYRPVPEDTVNVANYYRSPSSHYSQYPPGLPQTASVQQYPPQALPRSQTNQVHITPRDQLPSTPASDRINQELAIYMANDLHESRQRLAQAPPNVAFTSTSSVSTSNSTSSSIPNPEVASMFAETKQLIYIKEKIYGDSNEKANVDVSELYANKVPPFPRREKAKRLKNVPQHYDRLPEPFEQKDIIVNSGELDPVTDASVYKSVNRAVLTLIKTHRQSKKQKEKNLFMSEIWTTHLAHHVLTHIQSALPNVQSTVTTVHYEMTTSKLRLALKAALDQLEDGEIVDSNSLDCISREPSNARNAKFLENFLASICATPIDKSESNSVNFVTAEPSKFYDENPDCREIRSLRDYLQLFLNTVPGEGNEQGSAEVGSARCVFMVFKNNDSKGNVIGCHNFVMSYGALLKGAAAAQNIKVGPFRPYRTDASRLPNNQNIYRLGHGGVDSTVELDTTHEGCSLLYYSGLYDRTDPKQYATFLCCSMEFMPIDSHKELLKELGLTLIGVARTPEKQSASDEDLRRIARENPTKKFISPDTVKLDLAIPCFTEKMCLVYHQRITLDKYDLGFKDYAQAVDTILANIASHFDSNDAQARIKHDIMRPFAFAQMYCENIYKNLICYGISNAFLTASCSPSNSISRSPKTYREKCKDICLGTQRILGKIFSLFTKGQAESCFNEIQTLVENNAQMSDEEKKIVVSERAFYHISKLNITDVLLGMDRPLKSSTDLRNQYERSRDLGKLQPAWNHHERDFERERIVDFELNDKDFDQRNNYDHELWNANTPEERKLAMINITAKVLSKETSVSFDMVKHGILAEWKDDIKLSNTPSNEEIERILRPLNAQTRAAVQSLFLWERIHSYMDTSVTESRWTIEGLNKLFPRLAPVGTKAQAIKEQLILNPERGNFRIKIRQLKQLESPTMEPLEGAKVNKKQEKRNDGNDDQSKRIGAKRKDRDDSQNGPPTKSHNGPKSYNQYNQNGVNFAVPSLPYFTEADLCSSGVRNYAESTVSIDSAFDSLPSIDTPAKAKLLGNDEMTTLQAAIDIWETASIRSIESSVSLPMVEEGPAAEKDITDTAVIARREKRRLSLDSAQNSDTEAPLDYIPSSKKTNTMSEVPPVEVLRLDTTAPQKSSTKSDTPQILSPCSVSSSDSGSRDGKKRGQSYLLFNSLYGVLTEDVNNSSQSSRCTSEEIDIVGRKKESPRLEQDTRFIVPSPSLVAKRLSPLVSKRSSQSQEPTALPVEKVRRVEQVQDFHQDTVPNVKEEVHFYYKKRYVIQKDFNAKTATIIVSKRKARGKRSEMQPSAKAEIINRLFNEGKTVLPLIFDGNSLALVTMEELWDKTNLSSSSGLQRRVRKTCSSESVSRIESANFRRLSETLKRPLPVTEFLVAKRARQSATLPEPLTIPNSSRPLIITKAALKELPSRTRERYLARSLSHEENHEHQAGTKSPLRSPLTDSDSDVDKGLVIDTGSDDEGVVSEDEQEPFVIYDAPSPVASPSPVDSPTHVQLKEVSKRLLIDIPFSTPPRLPKLCTKAKSAGHSPIGYLFAEKMSLRHCFTQFRKQGRLTGLTERLKESAPDHCANGKLLRKFLFVAEKELHRHKASDHCDVLLRKPSVFRKRSQSTDRFFPRPLKEHFAEVWEIAQDSLYLEEQSSPLLSPAVGHNYSRPSNSSSVLCSPASKSNYRSPLAQDVRFPGYEQLLNSFMPKSPDGLLYFRSLDLEHVYFPFTHSALLSQQFMKPF